MIKPYYDVAIVGGGPGGSTLGTLLRKYAPELSVGIFEREVFPRDHVGESQLPPIGAILEEMGCYDRVEAANFPIKIGATFRWGQSDRLWDFELVPYKDFIPQDRPRKFGGQTRELAFQVDRSIYDKILLDKAAEDGCEVFQNCKVSKINSEGDRVTGFIVSDGQVVEAKYYIDASGNSGILRRAMNVPIHAQTKLQNVAFWDYWDNTEWATQFEGGATRILIMSIGCGWIWYIPIGATRTSIGFVCPAVFFKEQGKKPEEMYRWALDQEPLIAELTKNATCTDKFYSTKDWSYVADRNYGENWFLVGECAGFADPILSAGLTLTHTAARELAYTIAEMEHGTLDHDWMKEHFERNQTDRVSQHIRFADFWYAGNGIFTDLESFTREIADDAGLDLDPKRAFKWFASGGFTHDNIGQVGLGGLDLAGARQVAQVLFQADYEWSLAKVNVLRLNTDNSKEEWIPIYVNGKIERVKAYTRGRKILPLVGLFKVCADILRTKLDVGMLMQRLQGHMKYNVPVDLHKLFNVQVMQVLEVMLDDGWISGKFDPRFPKIDIRSPREGLQVHDNEDLNLRIMSMGQTDAEA